MVDFEVLEKRVTAAKSVAAAQTQVINARNTIVAAATSLVNLRDQIAADADHPQEDTDKANAKLTALKTLVSQLNDTIQALS